jgi:hypothetical protein
VTDEEIATLISDLARNPSASATTIATFAFRWPVLGRKRRF